LKILEKAKERQKIQIQALIQHNLHKQFKMRELELRSSPNKCKNMEIKTGIIYCKNLKILWNRIRDHLNIFFIIFLKFQP
jgi:hypothetical protein